MSKELKQSVYTAIVLVVFMAAGVGAFFMGTRIDRTNKLMDAVTQVLGNAKTIEELNATITQQQNRIETLKSAKEGLDETEKSLQPDPK